jgi:transcriptional regulator with XRE-family HTH domain
MPTGNAVNHAVSHEVVNIKELGDAVRRKRDEMRLGLRAVADATGVSASTISRIENGTCQPSTENIVRLAEWLRMPMERFIGARDREKDEAAPVIYFPQEATPDIVEVHLRADRNLTPEGAAALAEMFRVAYKQFSRPSEEQHKHSRRR